MKFNTQEIFDRYTESEDLKEADIFHLYDTGEECLKDNSGYHDSRHFKLIAFNTKTMQKRDLGQHDGIDSFDDLPISKLRVYADGSFFIRLRKFAAFYHLTQNVRLTKAIDNTDCEHVQAEIRSLRCNCCTECGEILDVID